jgi:redox-sensitive bicupin YhaK (pirin superfamily)
MSAGRGVMHSEFNHSASEALHLLQIWILPGVQGIEPGYEETHFDAPSKRGRLALIASPDGRDGSVTIHQDAELYAVLIDGGESATHALRGGRKAYAHVARGAVVVNGRRLAAGDALMVEQEPAIELAGGEQAEVLLFDLN